MLMLKGAPDRVIGMCSTVYHQNKIINIDNNLRKELEL